MRGLVKSGSPGCGNVGSTWVFFLFGCTTDLEIRRMNVFVVLGHLVKGRKLDVAHNVLGLVSQLVGQATKSGLGSKGVHGRSRSVLDYWESLFYSVVVGGDFVSCGW